MSEGALIEGTPASDDPARSEAEERVLGRLDHALRSLRKDAPVETGRAPLASVAPALSAGSSPGGPAGRRSLHPDRKRAALAMALAHAHFGSGALDAAERELQAAEAAGVRLSPSVREEIEKFRIQLATGDSGQGRDT